MQDTTQATSSPSSLAIGQLCSLYEVSAPLSDLHGKYQDTPEAHTALYNYCLDRVQETPYLRQHRDFIESKQFGYGERPFHWMWHTLVSAMPANFRFLEIGVFQGQTLSLAQLAAREQGKRGTFVGVTPLDSTGDRTATHPALNYQARIARLHREFGLDAPTILKGLSFDPRVQQVAREDGPYNLVFIDGCHDYEVVMDDISVYGSMVAPGGFLVIDDAANDLQIPDGLIPLDWRGIAEVTKAVQDSLYNNPAWEHVLALGHNRVFRRVGG